MSETKPSRKTKRPATPSPLTRAERAVVRAAMGFSKKWMGPEGSGYGAAAERLVNACTRLAEERQKARRVGR